MRPRKTIYYSLLVCSACVGFVSPAYAFDWADLWSTAEQRAEINLEKQQYDELIENAPNANWRGLGEYRKGKYAAAAKSFAEQRKVTEEAGRDDEALRAMYNQANAHVFEENYPEALNLFDEILELDPQHDNAKHNRGITQQLLEQQQQQSDEQGEKGDENQDSPNQQQDQQESGEGQESEQQNNEQSDDKNQDSSQKNDQNAEDQQPNSSSADNASPNDVEASEAAQDQAEQDAAAAAAMQAEQQRQADAEQSDGETNDEVLRMPAPPLTEREQANEQWLRQIPDDPAGLLERKLQNRHLTDFPTVRDSDEPW